MEIQRTEVVDDGTKRDRCGRRIAGKERVEGLLREYEASGMTQMAFAQRAGIKYPTFTSWVRARKLKAKNGGAAVRFAQIEVPSPHAETSELSVVLPDGVIVRGAGVERLAALVWALRR